MMKPSCKKLTYLLSLFLLFSLIGWIISSHYVLRLILFPNLCPICFLLRAMKIAVQWKTFFAFTNSFLVLGMNFKVSLDEVSKHGGALWGAMWFPCWILHYHLHQLILRALLQSIDILEILLCILDALHKWTFNEKIHLNFQVFHRTAIVHIPFSSFYEISLDINHFKCSYIVAWNGMWSPMLLHAWDCSPMPDRKRSNGAVYEFWAISRQTLFMFSKPSCQWLYIPSVWTMQNLLLPPGNCSSISMCFMIHFPWIRRKMSSTPIGLTPGFSIICKRHFHRENFSWLIRWHVG